MVTTSPAELIQHLLHHQSTRVPVKTAGNVPLRFCSAQSSRSAPVMLRCDIQLHRFFPPADPHLHVPSSQQAHIAMTEAVVLLVENIFPNGNDRLQA
ncbi:hypothetical protein Q9966_015094 [Columba livia]|nr:hypothetical protein Q9966_015094 [Columba livia]